MAQRPGGVAVRVAIGKPPKRPGADDLGAPADFGAPPASSPRRPPQPQQPQPGDASLDTDHDGDIDQSPTIAPEALNYHEDAQSCSTCQYMGEDGMCAVLKINVTPEGACNAWSGGEGQQQEMGSEGDQDDEDLAPAGGGAYGGYGS